MAMNLRTIGRALRAPLRFLKDLGRPQRSRAATAKSASVRTSAPATSRTGVGAGTGAGALTGTYPGDFRGTATIRYSPSPDGRPDPGEVVWTWVPYEEDHSRGKDRPVLLVGSHGRYLLGLMLTSKDHDGHPRGRRDYVDIGTGPWDRQWRPSEAKLDRVLQIHAADIRREGAILDRGQFFLVADALRQLRGWK
ncbi:type II toxin-antitoxin system PemK/MazF family toxin [Arthrobacter sp. ZGTC131]|uniref:type II toxin-antitoxin system PemK/MazF family toxin n=1 Tax=Arthrobacter sp. ZGTC131 TaxID=2058898 RepID=UPI000CE4F2C5|nr:type II toxin-antitoxin system PemK/MazF family toxin [Arthrobacter sp. ZGTC131]